MAKKMQTCAQANKQTNRKYFVEMFNKHDLNWIVRAAGCIKHEKLCSWEKRFAQTQTEKEMHTHSHTV